MAKVTPQQVQKLLHEYQLDHEGHIRIETIGRRSARARFRVGRKHLRRGDTVSGPILMALADVTMYAALLGEIGLIPLAVTPSLPAKNLKEFIEYAEARGGKLNMASAGTGSSSHLAGVMFMLAAGIDSLHVPYKGGGATIGAVMSNESQWLLSPAAAVISLARSGQLRALGHTLPQRSALFPDVPPITETVPGFSYSGWAGLVAPRGTPRPILDKVHRALIAAVNTPQVKEALTAQAAEVVTNNPVEFRRFVQQELAATGEAVKASGLKAD